MTHSHRRTSTLLALCVVTLVALGGACGGASRGDLNETFARIQVEEARIERADTARVEHDDARACDEICDATSALCELARESEDRDALARCERAEGRCSACRAEPEEPAS